MSVFGDLQSEDRDLLIGLLYRAGVWMSHSDDETGEADDVREMKALEHIIKSIASVHEQSEFVQDIARETISKKEQWPIWTNQSFDILGDCEKGVAVLKSNVNDNDLKAYRKTLVHIAETVAAAYGEFGMGADEDESALSGFLGKVVGKLKGESQEDADFMNISPAEDEALVRLKTALRFGDD